MTQAQHTPGPWFSRESRSNPNLRVICTNNRSEKIALTNGDEAGKANARLIAAAPELLEALEGLADAALDTTRPFYPQPHHKSLGMAIEQARAAIAKARRVNNA